MKKMGITHKKFSEFRKKRAITERNRIIKRLALSGEFSNGEISEYIIRIDKSGISRILNSGRNSSHQPRKS